MGSSEFYNIQRPNIFRAAAKKQVVDAYPWPHYVDVSYFRIWSLLHEHQNYAV